MRSRFYARYPNSLLAVFIKIFLALLAGTLFGSSTAFYRRSQLHKSSHVANLENHQITSTATSSATLPTSPTLSNFILLNRPAEFIVHYVKFYAVVPPDPTKEGFSYMECLSLLSVMVNIDPDIIYYHTNFPDFWPFDTCAQLISKRTEIKLIHRQRKFRIGGQRVHTIHHQADIAKLEVLNEFGGLVLDPDVFIIHGEKIRDLLGRFECIVGRENPMLINAGFAACKKGAKYPRRILAAYQADYKADWLYNSGYLPMKILNEEPELQRSVFVDESVSDDPPAGHQRFNDFMFRNGVIKWEDRIGIQTFWHDKSFDSAALSSSQSSFGDLLRWILLRASNPHTSVAAARNLMEVIKTPDAPNLKDVLEAVPHGIGALLTSDLEM